MGEIERECEREREGESERECERERRREREKESERKKRKEPYKKKDWHYTHLQCPDEAASPQRVPFVTNCRYTC